MRPTQGIEFVKARIRQHGPCQSRPFIRDAPVIVQILALIALVRHQVVAPLLSHSHDTLVPHGTASKNGHKNLFYQIYGNTILKKVVNVKESFHEPRQQDPLRRVPGG
jgi:hypothetical protein